MTAEYETLTAILFDEKSCGYAFEILKPEYFSNLNNKRIFGEMVKLHDSGTEVNILTLSDILGEDEYLSDLSMNAFTAARIKSSSDIVSKEYYKRTARLKLGEILDSRNDYDPAEMQSKIEDVAHFLSNQTKYRGLQSMQETARETIKSLDEISRCGVNGVKTGFDDMDRLGFTFRPGTLNVIGARPAMGKSALALDLAERCGVPVAFFSLEMEAKEQFERMLSKRLQLSNTELRRPAMIKSFHSAILKHSKDIMQQEIWINDNPSISTMQMRMQCKRMQAIHGLGLIIVDYMGYMKNKTKYESRRVEMGAFSRGLKETANVLNVPVIALSQLNRSCEERKDKRPMLSDLRETGDIEQDAHMVWLLYRDCVYNTASTDPTAEILICKNRGGQLGVVKLEYIKEQTTFTNHTKNKFNRKDWNE